MRENTLALPVWLLLALLASQAGHCAEPAAPRALEPSTVLLPPPRGDAARQLPIVLQGREISGQPGLETSAQGDVEFRRGRLVISADRLSYDASADLATAKGRVRVVREGAVYNGPELALKVQRFEGYFLQPEFEFPRLGAGGRADRLDFLGDARSRATNAQYTSCPRDGAEEPAWVLTARSVSLDLDTNEGVADGAVLRFLGLPILALPKLSFPLGDQRRSGWLPPSVNVDNRGGLEVGVPYYWDIAPNRDATIAPRLITRRGMALDTEFRYLEPAYQGSLAVVWLPDDRVARRTRDFVRWSHDGQLGAATRYSAELERVSDDDWWKDFRSSGNSLTTRLLPLRLGVEHSFAFANSQGTAYARALQWQVLQAADAPIASPYQRSPQIGVRLGGQLGVLAYTLESEYNNFSLPTGTLERAGRVGGQRVHALGSLSLPFRPPGWWVVPRLSVNAAGYEARVMPPGTGSNTRVIPSFSIDSGLELERRTRAFGRELQQTLEPRLLYVNTPYKSQSQFPVYDTAAKDFNFTSIFTDNAFSGVDRVSDAHQLTAGVTTRLVDTVSGAEALRLGLVQRYLFRRQLVTAQPDGTPDGAPLEQRLSDLLLLGSTSVVKNWTLDAALQYSPDISRSVRSITSARYSPGPFRTVAATYRLARGLSEQLELGWQWPIWGRPAAEAPARRDRSAGTCSGAWYSVGRVNYSIKDSRVTDSVLGLEYDSGCWIARVVAEQLSTGRSEATTRVLLQLELVGLSRLGSNPLKVLKDNIPGYRLLRDERRGGTTTDDWQP